MSRFLQKILNAEEPLFSQALLQLERASGQPGADARLIGDMHQQAADRIRRLGLSPNDSTGEEVYQALLARIADDNKRIAKLVGADDIENVRHVVPLLVKAAKSLKIDRSCWALKHSVAKKLLKQMPPKKLMKHLGYRSIDSMLRRENIDEIYTALRFSEGSKWLNDYNELFKTIQPSDFEIRDINILVMDHDKYVDLAKKFVAKKLHNVTHTKEMGVIVVVPMQAEYMKGIILKTLPMILHYINEIRLYSAFFKLKQVSKHFGEVVVETLIADPGGAAVMAGSSIHWRVIQRYFGKLKDEDHPEDFEPHVHPEDLHWRRAEDMLFQLDPAMEFWKDMDYVCQLYDNQPLSFNLVDCSFSYSNQNNYPDRLVYHARESLWNEIFARYMGMKNLRDQVLVQLDNDMIAPEKLKVSRT